MGLLKAAAGSIAGVMSEQWKDYYYCEALQENTLAVRGCKNISKRSSNFKGSENIISDGSLIAVADGQCMMIVEQGQVLEFCAEPGVFVFDSSSEPTIFCGNLGEGIKDVFHNMARRFTFGGEAPKDQSVYYFNTKEIMGNRYGTANPVPFRVVDRNIGLDMDISIKCFGEFSYRITNPLLFYKNVCGNIEKEYRREQIDGQLKTELMTALQPAFARISGLGIRYSSLAAHTGEIADALNEVLSEKWKELRGIEVVSFGISGLRALPEDERMIKELQRNAVFQDPGMAAAQIVGAQSEAMKTAAANENAGPAMAFMGMNMAANAGGANAEELFRMAGENRKEDRKEDMEWVCSCGSVNHTSFCPECGAPRPSSLKVRCAQCGWESDGLAKAPNFCPNCGKPLN